METKHKFYGFKNSIGVGTSDGKRTSREVTEYAAGLGMQDRETRFEAFNGRIWKIYKDPD